MGISTKAVKGLMIATADATVGNEIATVLNDAKALVAQTAKVLVAAIVATAVSQTTDFGALKVGDQVLMIPAAAGNADLITITVVGDLGQAAVVGNIYMVYRALVTDAVSALKF